MTRPIVMPRAEGAPLVELAAAVPDDRQPVLLDGGEQASPMARWSLLAFDPLELVSAQADPGGDALGSLRAALARRWPAARSRNDDDTPAFRGGAIGYLGFDLGRQLERVPERCTPDAALPDLHMGLHAFALAEEVGTGRRLIVGRGTDAQAAAFARSVDELQEHAAPLPAPAPAAGAVCSTFTHAEYLGAVQAVREHILDGDVYQVNLCQRFELPYAARPEPLQAALRRRFPAPFAALIRAPGFAVLSSSPELFLRRRGTAVESRPIKGTRPRDADPARDAMLRAALEGSTKERAELAMIVDLVRNDLGRSAEIGSVSVDEPFDTEAWSTVFHRVATVRSRVATGLDATDLVRAAFPPASVTGTPKIAALGVIEELEPVRRHVYTGAIGWIGADGDLDLSVAIRIATLVDGRLLLPFGGGITLASEAQAEYEETLHKARALFDVLGVTGPGAGVRA